MIIIDELQETDVSFEARVCSACRCRVVRDEATCIVP